MTNWGKRRDGRAYPKDGKTGKSISDAHGSTEAGSGIHLPTEVRKPKKQVPEQ